MATSLNKMIDGSKLFPGYKFLVTVDTYSENVVLVTGFIGSRKYKGALLDLPCNYVRGCVADSVFTSDFSSKNNYSFTNMAITNYYSHKKFKNTSNTTLISLNKRAKDNNYICTNCKMKISYFPKKESKSPPIETSSKIASNPTRSDITVLKQTLSYPDISDEVTPPTSTAQQNSISLSNIPEKTHRTLKRKKHQTNHVIPDKKPKIIVAESEKKIENEKLPESNKTRENIIENSELLEKKTDRVEENIKSPSLNLETIEKILEKYCLLESDSLNFPIVQEQQQQQDSLNDSLNFPIVQDQQQQQDSLNDSLDFPIVQEQQQQQDSLNDSLNFPIVQDQQQQQQQENRSVTFKETEIELENNNIDDNIFEIEDKSSETQTEIYDNYRSMPLSLVTLNHITNNSMENNDKTNEDSLKECPKKPKKIWMKMIENEDNIEKTSESDQHLTSSSESVAKQPIIKINKSSSSTSSSSHSNRSYKIKQTFYDKVILTIDKRPEKQQRSESDSLKDDIYTFSDESEININLEPAQEEPAPPNNLYNILPKSSFEDSSSINIIIAEDVVKPDESIKSSHSSSSSKSSSLSTKISFSLQNLSDDISGEKSEQLDLNVNLNLNVDDPSLTVKMEPDSTTNNFVSVISSCENNKGVAFNLNDIVWAKITGYPFWPAKIISFSQEDDSFIGCIEWYAWNEVSFIKVNNLFHFNQYFPSKYQKRNRNGKYQEAVKLAKFDCGMIDSVPVTAATNNTTGSSSVKGSDTDGSDSNAASL